MAKRKQPSATDRRQLAAEALIVWFGGFGRANDELQPEFLTWKEYTPLEQMRTLKAAEAVIAALDGGTTCSSKKTAAAQPSA